jgi:hypothetical protein
MDKNNKVIGKFITAGYQYEHIKYIYEYCVKKWTHGKSTFFY